MFFWTRDDFVLDSFQEQQMMVWSRLRTSWVTLNFYFRYLNPKIILLECDIDIDARLFWKKRFHKSCQKSNWKHLKILRVPFNDKWFFVWKKIDLHFFIKQKKSSKFIRDRKFLDLPVIVVSKWRKYMLLRRACN